MAKTSQSDIIRTAGNTESVEMQSINAVYGRNQYGVQVRGVGIYRRPYLRRKKLISSRIFEDAPLMWRRINSIGIILDCNSAYADNLGYSKAEIRGKTIFEHVADGSRNAMTESLKAWFELGVVSDRRIKFRRRDGTVFPILLDATSIFDGGGNLMGSNTAIFDLSDTSDEKIAGYARFFADAQRHLGEIKTAEYPSFDYNEKQEFDATADAISKLAKKDLGTLQESR